MNNQVVTCNLATAIKHNTKIIKKNLQILELKLLKHVPTTKKKICYFNIMTIMIDPMTIGCLHFWINRFELWFLCPIKERLTSI